MTERVLADGRVEQPLDEARVAEIAQELGALLHTSQSHRCGSAAPSDEIEADAAMPVSDPLCRRCADFQLSRARIHNDEIVARTAHFRELYYHCTPLEDPQIL